MERKILVAMSGGVDSSVVALLMRKTGVPCVGATMKLIPIGDIAFSRENACCSEKDVEDAKNVAASLGMEHYVFSFSERFREAVIDRFVSDYERGRTPNPCVECNRHLKFSRLYEEAEKLGCDTVATGHYARIERDETSGRYLLKKALDPDKDQSYVLYSMTQEELAHTRFPLGEMTKAEARAIAEANGLCNAAKHDSQDICFVKGESYVDFIERYTGKTHPHGHFVDENGTVLGEHRGIIRYTVGQRKGLGLSLKEPLYVLRLNVEKNEVVLGKEDRLFSREFEIEDVNLIAVAELTAPMRVKAKVRYRQSEQWATAYPSDNGRIRVVFDEPQRAVTSGQSAVLYDGDVVVGGGIIV